tara:strand:- start:25269 stop:26651 length:1383 start_codon:yes stop_codon:yes gene_type:complete
MAAATQATNNTMKLDAAMIQEIATEAYIYAYPLVLMEITRRVNTNVDMRDGGNNLTISAPMNTFCHLTRFPDDSFDAVVRPNADTLYSALWYDVSEEPLIITVPDSGGRYYLLPIMDMWTHSFSSAGTRTTGNHAQTLAIVDRAWSGKLPEDVRVYRSPTSVGWMIGRTQTNGASDYAAVRAFQAGITAVPLSSWNNADYTPPTGEFDPALDMGAPVDQVRNMPVKDFFELFAELTIKNPPHFDDYPVVDRMARIGLVTGHRFSLDACTPDVRKALEASPAEGMQKIITSLMNIGELHNGWRMIGAPMGTYATDFRRRAAIAFFGLGAVPVEDAVYPGALLQADGKPFDSAADYVIHFDKDQLPPVRAFWSLTMYNERQLFAANMIDRFAIGDRDPLQYNADGSLDLYIQRRAPDVAKQSNWLPAPASGSFSMNLRLYWPKQLVLDGQWVPPQVVRITPA